jgi:hypothetical protein
MWHRYQIWKFGRRQVHPHFWHVSGPPCSAKVAIALVAHCLLRILCSRPNYTLVPAAQMSVNLVYGQTASIFQNFSKFDFFYSNLLVFGKQKKNRFKPVFPIFCKNRSAGVWRFFNPLARLSNRPRPGHRHRWRLQKVKDHMDGDDRIGGTGNEREDCLYYG